MLGGSPTEETVPAGSASGKRKMELRRKNDGNGFAQTGKPQKNSAKFPSNAETKSNENVVNKQGLKGLLAEIVVLNVDGSSPSGHPSRKSLQTESLRGFSVKGGGVSFGQNFHFWGDKFPSDFRQSGAVTLAITPTECTDDDDGTTPGGEPKGLYNNKRYGNNND